MATHLEPQKDESTLQPRAVQVEIAMQPAGDVPVLYANQLFVSFFGNEFIVSPVVALPEPSQVFGTSSPPTRVDGRVLARYAFSPEQWYAVVQSLNTQLDTLQREGLIRVPAVVAPEATSEET